jgi:hypothetical protein
VSRIKTIQTRIEARRKAVLSLHQDCVLMKSGSTSSTRDILMLGGTTAAPTTNQVVAATSAAASVAASTVVGGPTIAPVVAADTLFGDSRPKMQIVTNAKMEDVPGPGQVLFVRKN